MTLTPRHLRPTAARSQCLPLAVGNAGSAAGEVVRPRRRPRTARASGRDRCGLPGSPTGSAQAGEPGPCRTVISSSSIPGRAKHSTLTSTEPSGVVGVAAARVSPQRTAGLAAGWAKRPGQHGERAEGRGGGRDGQGGPQPGLDRSVASAAGAAVERGAGPGLAGGRLAKAGGRMGAIWWRCIAAGYADSGSGGLRGSGSRAQAGGVGDVRDKR